MSYTRTLFKKVELTTFERKERFETIDDHHSSQCDNAVREAAPALQQRSDTERLTKLKSHTPEVSKGRTELSSHYFTARNVPRTFFGGLYITAGNSNPTEYPSHELSSYE